MTNTSSFKNLLSNFYILGLSFFIIFGRSFSGLKILSFRVGELVVGLLIIISFITIAVHFKNKDYFIQFNKQIYTFGFLIILFFISLFVNQGNLFNLYSFKSSSYIWTTATIFFSYFLLRDHQFNKTYKYIFSILLFVVYFFSTIHYPQVFINFFTTYSDRWDFVKASDIFLIYVLTNTFNYFNFSKKINAYVYFMFSSAILLPLFLFMSKGSFFPAVVFVLTFFIIYFKFTKKHILKLIITLLISSLLFVVSTYEVWGNLNFEKGLDINQNNAETLLKVDTLKRNISDISQQKNTSAVFASIYFSGNRIYSTEMMLNWRLQIWQDIIFDLGDKNKTLFGYGYNDIIPIMDDSQRRGTDGTNENVHNYFFNILARGGVFQLITILLFMFFMFLEIEDKNKKLIFLASIVPLYMTSFFDASMESVRFPLIFYFGIVLIFKLDSNKSRLR